MDLLGKSLDLITFHFYKQKTIVWRGVLDTTNKTDSHDIGEMLLKLAP